MERRTTREIAEDYFLQVPLATAGAMLIGLLTAIILAAIIAIIFKYPAGSNFGERFVDQGFLNLAGEPHFVFPILAGAILGYISPRFFRSGAAKWVWIVPGIVVLWNILTWKGGGFAPYWKDVWDNYFGSGCSGSECLYELFVTARSIHQLRIALRESHEISSLAPEPSNLFPLRIIYR